MITPPQHVPLSDDAPATLSRPWWLFFQHLSRAGAVSGTPLKIVFSGSQAQVGVPFSASLTATGGTLPYTFTSGSLPAGLSLNAGTGAISGTPTTAGTVTFTGTVTDGDTITATVSCTINVAQASGASVLIAVSTAVGRDVGHGSDIPAADTRLVSFQVGAKATYASTPNQYGTVYLSRDGGTTFLGIGWYLWTSSGQEFFFNQVRPTTSATWKIAICPGTIQYDAANAIATASLPTGTVQSAGFSVAGLSLPGATDVTSLTIAAGSGADPNFPYDAVQDGKHYFYIPSVSYSDAGVVGDAGGFFVRITAQDYDSAGNAIGPELPFAGTQVTNGQTLTWGPLQGNYGIYGWTYTRPGSLAKVRLRVYVANRINQGPNSFADATSAVLQTSVGSGAGYVDVTVAVGGAVPNGAITTNQLDPTVWSGGGIQTDPITGRAVIPNNNFAASVIQDPSFEYSTAGVLGGAGNTPGWSWGLSIGSSIEIKTDGGNSGANYARMTGPDAAFFQSVSVQPGLSLYVQIAARSSNTAGAAHAIGIYVTWLDVNNAPLSPYTTIVGTVSGFVSAWTNNALSGYATAPSGAAKAVIKIATSAGEPGYWDLDDVLYQPTINQTANGQNASTVQQSGVSSDPTAVRAASTSTTAFANYGGQRIDIVDSSGYAFRVQVGSGSATMMVSDPTAANAIEFFVVNLGGSVGLGIQQNITGTNHNGVTGDTVTTSGGVRHIYNGIICP